ncbi:MAG: DnaJ domain-containing protein [Planctomycetota bacterium]|jgi:molecular chaperone DnaJ
MKSHYDVLGVKKSASPEEIKRAYRKLALEWHPDKHPDDPNAEDRFKHIVLAYEVLKDPDKKAAYDRGFDPRSGVFDPTNIDPTLLDPNEFLKVFSQMFGEYLDERIPGGFKDRVGRAAQRFEAEEKKKKKKSRPKKKPKTKVSCKVCNDRGRVTLNQGGFKVSVACRACEHKKAS